VRTDLDALIDHLQARFALIPESRGKKKRGLALLEQFAESLPAGSRLRPAVETAEQANLLTIYFKPQLFGCGIGTYFTGTRIAA
jgi:hypothetical protein